MIVERVFKSAQVADYAKRVILTPSNVESWEINKEILNRHSGVILTFYSTDDVEKVDPAWGETIFILSF